jgi:hypothetical protein
MLDSNSENYALHDEFQKDETDGHVARNLAAIPDRSTSFDTRDAVQMCIIFRLSVLCGSIPGGLKFCTFYGGSSPSVSARGSDHGMLGSTALTYFLWQK